ncbi:hypothetical protein D3C87_408660 [compost metagenome]
MPQELIPALLFLAFAFVLLVPAIRLEKKKHLSFSLWIRIVIVFLWGIGVFLTIHQLYIPESYPLRIVVLLPLSISWICFTAVVIVKIFKMLNKGWKKALFLVPTLLIVSIWTLLICSLSILNYHSSDLLHSKYSSHSNPEKTLYVFPNSGAWFAKPGFSFYYRAGRFPVMEHKTGYSTIEIKKITREGDRVICDLRTTRTLFSNSNIQLIFNLETGAYSEH